MRGKVAAGVCAIHVRYAESDRGSLYFRYEAVAECLDLSAWLSGLLLDWQIYHHLLAFDKPPFFRAPTYFRQGTLSQVGTGKGCNFQKNTVFEANGLIE